MPLTLLRLACVAALAYSAAVCMAQTVTPPPPPPGHDRVRPDAGLQEPERKRYVRAHHHKFEQKRDYTKDDSENTNGNGNNSGSGNGNGNGNGKNSK
jgi:hypothetical protein